MMYPQVLASDEKASGPHHPSTLIVIRNLNILYAEQDMMEDVKRMYS